MESSGAGCFESFLGLLSVMTQWPAESGCSLQQSAVTPLQHHLKKVLAVTACYVKHMLYYIPWFWKDVSQRTVENAIATDSHICRTTMLQDSRCDHLWRMRNSRLGSVFETTVWVASQLVWCRGKKELKLRSTSCRKVWEWKSLRTRKSRSNKRSLVCYTDRQKKEQEYKYRQPE